ncbi:hypothetical protein RIF29_38604 [Crotalaria pallida]|uniref:Uncharacterized protein n=1 Tax=Crotalaria pallida TaxID=3830 RepID=A0AAN9E227_CROPI
MLRKEALELESKLGGGNDDGCNSTTNLEEIVRVPKTVRAKTIANDLSPHGGKRKRVLCCGICRLEGHTRKSCPMASQVEKFKKTRCVRVAPSDYMEIDEFIDTFLNNLTAAGRRKEVGAVISPEVCNMCVLDSKL